MNTKSRISNVIIIVLSLIIVFSLLFYIVRTGAKTLVFIRSQTIQMKGRIGFILNGNIAELELLRAQQKTLQAEIGSLVYLKTEQESLKSALNLQKEKSVQLTMVSIIGNDTDPDHSSALINKGSHDGLQNGQAVFYLGYLVGTLTEVQPVTAKIRFINDKDSAVAISIGNKSNSKGVLKSRYGLELWIDLISKNEAVASGDYVYTSGLDGLPSGLLIGKVKQVEQGPLFLTILVERSVEFYNITQAFVVQS